jgi:Uncharacterized membrane-associated protein
MNSWIDATLAWIAAHPVLAGAVIFAIAFCDAVIVLGAIVPALPLMIAVGVLIGLDEISGPYAVACAAVGAFAGDGISYWVGRRWGNRLRGVWPFRSYPQLLDRGELMFRRNAFKSILVARYVGAIRPFVPAIAGIAHMPFLRYAKASAVACISWAVLFLLPGWMLGQAYDAWPQWPDGCSWCWRCWAWFSAWCGRSCCTATAGRPRAWTAGWRGCWTGRSGIRCWVATRWRCSIRRGASRCRWRCWR